MDKRIYSGGFSSWVEKDDRSYGFNSVVGNFRISKDTPEPEYIWAEYDSGNWEGYAIAVYKEGDTWYQVYGSHCSCYGLEGQWEPEVLDVDLHFRALSEGKSLISGYMNHTGLNLWLKEMTQ